jgi:hypothetical protein
MLSLYRVFINGVCIVMSVYLATEFHNNGLRDKREILCAKLNAVESFNRYATETNLLLASRWIPNLQLDKIDLIDPMEIINGGDYNGDCDCTHMNEKI